jgi:hypothetical protein
LNISPTRREEAEEANKNCKTPRDVQAFGVDIQIALQSFALTELFGDRDTAWPRATLWRIITRPAHSIKIHAPSESSTAGQEQTQTRSHKNLRKVSHSLILIAPRAEHE